MPNATARPESPARLSPRICEIDGCGQARECSRRWCDKHLARVRRHGDPHFSKSPLMHASMAEKLAAFIPKGLPADQCWPWTGSLALSGYGVVVVRNRKILAHRASYEAHHGKKIPAGLEIDHVCRNLPCVNPAHLRTATHAQNMSWAITRRHRPNSRGVYRTRRRFLASISVNNYPVRLGVFDTHEEAARAYNEAAIRLRGEFAILNEVG